MYRPVRDEIWVEISLRQIKNRPGRDGIWVEKTLAKLMYRAVRYGMHAGYGMCSTTTFRT